MFKPEATELSELAAGAVYAATLFKVSDRESYLQANERREWCNERSGQAEAFMRPRIQEADKHHKSLVADLRKLKDPFDEGAKIYKGKMIAFEEEQKAIRDREQAKLDLEAKQKEEEERLELASLLEQAGAKDAADELLDRPVNPRPAVLPPATPKVDGFSYRTQYSAEVIDFGALIQAVCAGKVPIEVLLPNQLFLNQQARALKGALNYPGVKVVEKKV
jgi:hypothetical protein